MQFLKANTAVDVLIGPFVDEDDGKTAETALTLSQADIKLSKTGQTPAQKNDTTAAAHTSDGYYNCELDATDTNTEGTLVLIVHETGALPVRHEYMVLAEAAYDSLFVAKDTGFMDINLKAVSDSTTAADNQEVVFDTDFGTNYSTTDDNWVVNLQTNSIDDTKWNGSWEFAGGGGTVTLGEFSRNTPVTGMGLYLQHKVNGVPVTTGTCTIYYSLDGGAQSTIADTPTHVGNGHWAFDLTAAETNGDTVALLVTHTTAKRQLIVIRTTKNHMYGTCTGTPTTTTIQSSMFSAANASAYVGGHVIVDVESSTAPHAVGKVTSFDPATDTVTTTAMFAAPASGDHIMYIFPKGD